MLFGEFIWGSTVHPKCNTLVGLFWVPRIMEVEQQRQSLSCRVFRRLELESRLPFAVLFCALRWFVLCRAAPDCAAHVVGFSRVPLAVAADPDTKASLSSLGLSWLFTGFTPAARLFRSPFSPPPSSPPLCCLLPLLFLTWDVRFRKRVGV